MRVAKNNWCSVYVFYAFLVWIEVVFLFCYSLSTAISYFIAKVYWPVWYSGLVDVAGLQAAWSMQVWWWNNPVGMTAAIAYVLLGVSIYLNIINLAQLNSVNGQSG